MIIITVTNTYHNTGRCCCIALCRRRCRSSDDRRNLEEGCHICACVTASRCHRWRCSRSKVAMDPSCHALNNNRKKILVRLTITGGKCSLPSWLQCENSCCIKIGYLVSWCYEPSQPLGITLSGLKANFNPRQTLFRSLSLRLEIRPEVATLKIQSLTNALSLSLSLSPPPPSVGSCGRRN